MSFPGQETIRLAKENDWWEVEEQETRFPIPQNAKEFYALWERLTIEARGVYNVICFLPLIGTFDFRNGVIFKIDPIVRHLNNDLWQSGGTCQPANNAELTDLNWSIEHGCANLHALPCSNFSNWENIDLLYGTGKPFDIQNH